MCGIIGAVSDKDVVPFLLEGLATLEYRGYDSAGLAVVDRGLKHVKISGRVEELRSRVAAAGLRGATGIAHTRWATHGVPSEINAHPHFSNGLVGLVHNGIVENHAALRHELEAGGYRFLSDTDSEVIVHLVHRAYLAGGGDLTGAVRVACALLQGSYAIAVVGAEHPGQLVCARRGSPLVVGFGDGEQFVASDVYALLPRTRRFTCLEDGDVADLRPGAVLILNARGERAERPVRTTAAGAGSDGLGSYRHYMHKEIHEQPRVVADTIEAFAPAFRVDAFGTKAAAQFEQVRRVAIVACGTSYHAGLIARHWIEEFADLPCSVDVASEFRYRARPIDGPDTLLVLVSQSGETADTLGALARAREAGVSAVLGICNVAESSMARQSDLLFLTRAGHEIGVASTKAFTAQLAALYGLAAVLARVRGRIDDEQAGQAYRRLADVPGWLVEALALEPDIKAMAEDIATGRHALFIGRGLYYPVALEGALKLKEVSYIHAEAYPAGELKHGPLALVDAAMPVIALAPADRLQEKMKSNIQEVAARHGRLFVLADGSGEAAPEVRIALPGHYGDLGPLPYAVPLQLLAYYAAVLIGNDVDKPRNLAKSVTVE